MKNVFLSFTKKLIAVFIILELCSTSTFAGSGIFESYVIVQANGGSANYYDLFASTGNPDFQGLNFGTFSCTNSLVIKGGQNKTYKNGTDDILNGYLHYRVYKNGTDPNLVSFISINLGFDINLNSSGDQQWTNAGVNTNLLQGLVDGTYTIEIYSSADFTYNGGSGTHYQNVGGANYKATFTVSNPINITTQPLLPAAFCSGTNVNLTAAATEADTYIWQEEISAGNWSNISGASGSMNIAGETVSLTLTNLTTTKKVRCLFTNCGGINTLATSAITLAPIQTPITIQPVDAMDCYQNVVRFYVGASNVSYQWQRKKSTDADFVNLTDTDVADVSNSNTNYLRIVQAGSTNNVDGTLYRCKITSLTSPFCTNTSSAASILVNRFNTVSVTKSPLCVGESITFTSSIISGITRLQSYQWYKNNISTGSISGANASTYTTTIASTSDNSWGVQGTFQSNNTNSLGVTTVTTCVTSQNRGITVRALPTAPTANNVSRCDAGAVTLSATSTLNANESFRWYESNISTTVLGTAANYTTTSLDVGTYTYYLSVYNSNTTCESNRTPVIVTVNALPTITLGSIADICNSVTSFSVPFSATTNSPNQYSISVGSPALSGFLAINNATMDSSPMEVIIPANATPNTYQFIISVKNSTTTCVSADQTFTVKLNDTPVAPIVTSSINYCQNAPTSLLSAQANDTNTLLWYGMSSSGGISSFIAPTPGSSAVGTTSYYVSQKNVHNCESSRAVIDVIINAIPNAPSATTAVTYCKNSTATTLLATAAGSNSLIWYDENDSILGSAPTPNTTTVGRQIYKVSQKSPEPANCESPKTTITVTINDLPPAPTVVTPVGYCQNATATALSATASGSNILLWYGTSSVGGTSSGVAPTPLTSSTGTTSYFVSQKDANNCESPRAKIDIIVTPSVSASISGTNAFCITGVLNSSTILTANPTGGNGTYTYQWQNLAGNIASATSQTFETNSTIQAGNADTYKVTVMSGNCTATATITVTKQGWNDVPSVSVSPIGDICGSSPKILTIDSPSAFGTYKWFADATILTQITTGTSFSTPTLSSTTTYYVAREQQVTASLTCQTARTAATINVNTIPETPTVVNSANKVIFCNNESSFNLSASCTSGNGQYRLNNGFWTNGNSVTITPSSYSSVSTLNYDFKCLLGASCESAVSSTNIIINPVPNVPIISGNTSICAGGSTTLTANGCAGTVVWSNSTSATSIIVSSAGTYNATCTINNCVSVASATQTIVVNPIPSVPIIVSDDTDNIVCAGTNVKLSVSNCGGTVVWSNGASGTSISVSSSGTYHAICVVNTCVSEASSIQNIVVNQNPSISLGIINGICNTSTTFEVPYTATTNFPDKYSLVSTMPDFVVVAETNLLASPIAVTIPSGKTGTHSFSLTIKNSTTSCINSQDFTLTVLPVLLGGSIEVSSNTINCVGYNPGEISNVSLASGGKSNYVYQWQFSTDNVNFADVLGANLTLYNPPSSINQTTYYRRKVTDVCGTEAFSSNVHQVQIVADPQITLTDASERVICSGESVSLAASVIGGSGTCVATWQSSNTLSGTYANEQVGGLSFTQTLNNISSTSLVKYYRVIYNCSGTGSSACGQSISIPVKVTVNYVPNPPVVSGNTTICAGSSTTLTASGCAGTVIWSNLSTGSTLSVSLAGTYSATCTENSCTSLSSNIHNLTINTIPNIPSVVSDDEDNVVCAGASIKLSVSDCAGTVVWSNATSATSIRVSTSGTYSAICMVNNCVSAASITQTIVVNSIPNPPTIAGNVNICAGSLTTLTATGCEGNITWNTGITGTTLSVSSAGTYNATCTVNDCISAGSSIQTITVNQIPVPPIISGNTSICTGTSTILTANGCLGIIRWNSGVTGSTLSVSSAGTYTATCTENSCESLSSSVYTITENALPTITLSSINSVCNSATSFNLAYTATTNNPNKYSLTSTMPDFVAVGETNLLASPISVIIPSGKTGTHSFTLMIKNSITGCTNSQTFNTLILPVLVGGGIELSSGTVNCAGYNAGEISSVSLASGGKATYIYQWQSSKNGLDFTDISGATSTVYDPAGLSETTYFRRKVSDGCGAEAYSLNIHQVQIVPDPQISIASDKAIVCTGGAVNFNQTLLQGGTGTCTTTWKSSLSLTMMSPIIEGTGNELLLNLSNTGTTAVKRYIQATYDCSVGSCNRASSNIIEITINPKPSVPTISGGDMICSGSSTTLIASGCNGTLLWSNGATNTSISVSTTGSYSSVCTNSCGTSASSNEIVVNVMTIPPPILTGATTVCSGQSTTLSATGCAGVVVWSNSSSGTSITVSPSTTTSYTAFCNASGCMSVNSGTVVVTVAPSIAFSVGNVADLCNSAVSFDLPYTLSLGSPDKYSLTSTMAGFTSITEASLGISPISVTLPSGQTGTISFTLTLKISSTGCSNSQTFNVTVLPVLVGGSIETSSSTINCSGYNAGSISSVNLASGGKVTYEYQWQSSTNGVDFADILGTNLSTYDPPALTETTYYRRKVRDACGAEAISSNVNQIQIVADPQITITDVTDRTICSGDNLTLEATVIGGSGTCTPTWQSSNTQSGTYTNEQVGGLSFTATLTNATSAAIIKYYRVIYACSGVGSGSCNQSISSAVRITINPIPSVPIITPASVIICPTQSTTLTASGCNGLITWNSGQTGSILSVSVEGTFLATCTLNNCVSAVSPTASVFVASGGIPVPPPIISGTATICSGQFTTLIATNCSGSVAWSDGKVGTTISVNPSISTDYTATCFDGTCTSNNSNKITITVNSYPTITTQPKNEADCNGNSVTFTLVATSTTAYQWQRKVPIGTFMDIINANTNSLTITNVGNVTDPNQTEYRVVLSNQNCSVTSTVAVLTVNSVVGSLADQTICDGENVSFNLSAISILGNIQSYQWQRRVGTSGTWNDIGEATSPTLTINTATSVDEQYYRCKVNFSTGNSTTCARYTTEDDSNGAKLNILAASNPSITGTNVICLGRSTTLTANNCNGIIAWSSGQSTGTITISPIVNTSYTVSCTSLQCGFNVTSPPYLVAVNVTPQPEIITYDVVTPATLTFAARTTVPNATLMWYNRASGGTGTTTAPSFSSVGTYSYWVTQIDPISGCESARLPIIAKILDFFHIIQQPLNQADCKGNSVYFGVTAVGPKTTFTYQWQRKRPNEPNFVNLVEDENGIRGWYAQVMSVSNVGDANNPNQTQYRCIIGTNGEFLTSEISTLTVNSLEGSMPNLGICVGATNEFNLQNYFTITGNVLSYQWQTRAGTSGAWTNLNDVNGIVGSSTSVLKFTKATYEQSVYYRCLVTFNTQGFECTESTDAAKLIVSGFPPAPSVSNVFYCQNSNAVRLKVDSPIQNLVWYTQETGGTGMTTAPTPNTSTAGIFNYYVSDRTDEGCESPRAVINVEVGALPPVPKNTTLSPVNEGNTLTFAAEGTPSENQVLRWYTSPTTSTFSTTAPIFTAAGTYTRYVAQVSAFGCVSQRTAITATIIPSLKFTKQPVSQADCDGNSVTFSVTATAPNTFTYQWQYKRPNETSFVDLVNETSNLLKVNNIGGVENPNSTRYRCVIKDDKNTTISEEAVLTVNRIEGKLSTMSLCDGSGSKLSFSNLTITGSVVAYQWQKKVGSTYTDIPTNANGVATISEIGTYRGRISFFVDKTITCNRLTEDIKVEFKPSPVAPQVINQYVCQNTEFDIIKAVSATNSLLWYESTTDTTADKIAPKIDISKLNKITYFVSQISPFGCESERKSFNVEVATIPEKPIISDVVYCRNASSLALTATTSPQNQVIWYASLTAKESFVKTPIPNTQTDGETIYFAATKNLAGCESERLPLKVSIAPCIATFENNFDNCLQISADSVKGNKWFDLHDNSGRIYASVNPNGLNLGKVSIAIRHYGRGSVAIPTTPNGTKLMARYVDMQSSLLNEFPTDVSLRIYYSNEELNEYKTSANLPNLTINDFNIMHYDGIREDCSFENNDNFLEGNSYVIYKNVIGNQINKNFFYLQFDVNEFSENGATANDFTEISFSGKETDAKNVKLNWQSKYEIKAEKFILERSEDCKNFTKVGEIKATGTASSYESIDYQPFAGENCYRLVYIDKDGTKKYLDAIEVNFTDENPICSVFPNPWIEGDEIKIYLRNIKEKVIKLYDMSGQDFSFKISRDESKIIKLSPDVYLSKGIYFVVILGEDDKKCVQKIVINP